MKRIKVGARRTQKKSKLVVVLGGILFVLMLGACSSGNQPLAVGDKAPEFELLAADGDRVALSDYQGQPVLLYFHMALG